MLTVSCVFISTVIASDDIALTLFDESKVSFQVNINEIKNTYSVMSYFGIANQKITLKVLDPKHHQRIVLTYKDVELIPSSQGIWNFIMSNEGGHYPLLLRHLDTEEQMWLNVFIQHNFHELDADYKLRNYEIGEYPLTPFRGLDAYHPPKGFVKVTPELLHIKVSPHFSLGQFLCKQKSGYPKFIVLDHKILFKLEQVLANVNKHGIYADTFSLMSAYRTPSYNKSIGQGVYSRHQWGDAVDVFIDVAPKDGLMDDINKDGKVNQLDAAYLYTIVDTMRFQSSAKSLLGGLGDYSANSVHGPFVHIDSRGYRARWGNSTQ